MYKQGNARGAREVRRGTSSNHFHCPGPRSSSHTGPRKMTLFRTGFWSILVYLGLPTVLWPLLNKTWQVATHPFGCWLEPGNCAVPNEHLRPYSGVIYVNGKGVHWPLPRPPFVERASLGIQCSGVRKRVGFTKGGFGGCFWNESRNEGTFGWSPRTKNGTSVRSHVPPEWKTRTRVHTPKSPFYETALLFPLDTICQERTNPAFSKPCLCLSDTRHFRHFRCFQGSEERSPRCQFRVPQKECGKRSSITFFRFRDAFGHFLVIFSAASVTFFVTFLPNSFCRTPFAAG